MAISKVMLALAVFLFSLTAVFALESNNTESSDTAYFTNGNSTGSIVPVYRFWSQVYNVHFYTVSESEKEYVLENYFDVWTYEEIAFYAFANEEVGTVPVYRFWNNQTNGHFYTVSESEKEYVLENYSHVWVPEGIAFYVYEDSEENTLPVYRFWNNISGGHFYTLSEDERTKVLEEYTYTFVPEGIAFYAFASVPEEPEEELKVLNLESTDRSYTYILWEWDNPSEDFDGIAVYLDGENVANLTSDKTSYKARELEEDTIYTITLRIIKDGELSPLSVSDSVKTLEEEDDDDDETYVVRSDVADLSPVVFTSSGYTPATIDLNGSSLSKTSNRGFFESLTFFHYILAILVILCVIAAVFIFKNI